MRSHPVSRSGYGLQGGAVDSYARHAPKDLPADGPHVFLLYESEEERDHLSRRLREVNLDELPWELVDLRSTPRSHPRREVVRPSLGRVSDALGAGTATAHAVLSSHWTLVTALMLSPLPLFLMWRLTRGLNSPGLAAAT
jgi:hypothetical protein